MPLPGGGRFAADSLRTQALRELAPHFEHKLFLTATPHNGYRESFGALLELLDNQRFSTSGTGNNWMRSWCVAQERSRFCLQPPRPPGSLRILEPIEVPYTDEEREVHAALRRYTKLRTERATGPAEHFGLGVRAEDPQEAAVLLPGSVPDHAEEQHEKTLHTARKGVAGPSYQNVPSSN